MTAAETKQLGCNLVMWGASLQKGATLEAVITEALKCGVNLELTGSVAVSHLIEANQHPTFTRSKAE